MKKIFLLGFGVILLSSSPVRADQCLRPIRKILDVLRGTSATSTNDQRAGDDVSSNADAATPSQRRNSEHRNQGDDIVVDFFRRGGGLF